MAQDADAASEDGWTNISAYSPCIGEDALCRCAVEDEVDEEDGGSTVLATASPLPSFAPDDALVGPHDPDPPTNPNSTTTASPCTEHRLEPRASEELQAGVEVLAYLLDKKGYEKVRYANEQQAVTYQLEALQTTRNELRHEETLADQPSVDRQVPAVGRLQAQLAQDSRALSEKSRAMQSASEELTEIEASITEIRLQMCALLDGLAEDFRHGQPPWNDFEEMVLEPPPSDRATGEMHPVASA